MVDRRYRILEELKSKLGFVPKKEETEPPHEIGIELAKLPVSDRIKLILIENGYDTIEKIEDAGPAKIEELKGIGKQTVYALFDEVE